ncbi:MAG: hypothetical protein WEE64_06535 [Dehalococcoidia bacterium]
MSQRSEAERRAIRDYMAWQAGDEEISHLEKIASRRIGPDRYDIWDVWTDQARWWVITPGTNLYLQEDFQSFEVALTYHVGLMHVLGSRSKAPVDLRARDRGPGAWRKWEQAAEALENAEEAEDFQAVGMRLREGLLTFVRGIAADEYVPGGEERPQAANFLRWTELIAERVAAGSSRADLRRHLRGFARTTWQLANWLTHAQNATRGQAMIALTACDHLAGALLAAVTEHEQGGPVRCPQCGSYQLRTFFPSDGDDLTICAACDSEV